MIYILILLVVLGALWVLAIAGPRHEDDYYDYFLNDERENSDYRVDED